MTTTLRFRVDIPRAGVVRGLSQDLDVIVSDVHDVMPALHEAVGEWLVMAAPGVAGQEMTLWQHQHDPAAGLLKINEGRQGGGTWTQIPDPDEDQDNHEETAA